MTTLKDFGYEDIKVIGRGQYGKAHLVSAGPDKPAYVAKTIDLTCLSKKERETSLQEVELLRRLDHPNIVEYRDNFFMGDTLVIVMQYCEGGDLASYIKEMARRKMRIREVQIMNYFVQIVQALQYIHQQRILHRDLKTSNLFLMKSKQVVKLGDFGISRVLEGSTLAAITVVGTPYYMSPEVCENKPYTFKSDVWSLGCVLYEMCMLKHAFSADNLLGLVYKIVSDKYEPIPAMYSQALNDLIKRMLEKNAERRVSIPELLRDPLLQSFMNEYVRTRGQCAARQGGAAARQGGGEAAAAAGGGAGGAGGPAASGRPPRGDGAGGAASAGAGGGGGRSGAVDRGQRSVRQSRNATARQEGGARNETPKEAAARRKREAADRRAEKLKVAVKDSVQNKTIARRMKEAEFQTTRMGSGMPRGVGSPTTSIEAASTCDASTCLDDRDHGSMTPEEDYLETPLEEISEYDSEEYTDDFEDDDYCTEEEIDEYSDEGVPVEDIHPVSGVLSTVREEQDFSRVMENYEQDLARAGDSPPRRPGPVGQQAPPAATVTPAAAAPLAAPAVASPPQNRASSAGSANPAGGVMDIHSRAARVKEELIQKMGAETFEVAFNFLKQARAVNTDEKTVRRQLEQLVGRDIYKRFCFDVDQLVFQQMLYS
eukprot:TRINITY_DN1797_c0_g1_i1.p1 TRINITY_DN1797_c0_g1~~TRINITY_DN1797_c0_g1_i1.p1  ORF type:complete len:656 (-),score=177.80 TRINITY_DN1797_c0_g1_i1:74-2041(-)